MLRKTDKQMQISEKLTGILHDCGGKPGNYYPHMEPGKATNRYLKITIYDN